jgi:hypothetical protein
METNKLIQEYRTAFSLLEEKEKRLKEAKQSLKKDFQDNIKRLVETGKVCTLELHDYRDDSVSAIQVAQSAKVIIESLYESSAVPGFVVPILRKVIYTPKGNPRMKKGNIDTREVRFNAYCSWTLYNEDGEVLFENKAPEVIYPDKYKGDELVKIKERLLEVQKL